MVGIERYTRVLALFTETRGTWTVAELSEALDTSASTLYRIVRELVAAGFLESTVEAQYRLGAAFVDYGRRVRMTDPLIRSGGVFLQPLADGIGLPCTCILARLYGNTVMCVAEARSLALTVETSFARGRPMPLTRGATSRAILAGMDTRRLRRLVAAEGSLDPAQQAVFVDGLARVRRAGHSVTRGEVDLGAVGLAVPVRNRHLGIDASLSAIVAETDLGETVLRRILSLLATNARLIESFMEESHAASALDAAAPPAG